MIFFFEIGVVLVILFIIFLLITGMAYCTISWLANGIWIIAAILVLAHIISLIVNIIGKEKDEDNFDKLGNKIIGNTLSIIGAIIRIFTETVILYCILGGFTLRANIEEMGSFILAVLGFLINTIIFITLLVAAFYIEKYSYNPESYINYLPTGFINIITAIIYFFLSQVLMGFGNQEIMNTLFDNIPIVKDLYFLLFIVL